MPAPTVPIVDRPEIPAEYGVAPSADLVDWSHVEERLGSAREYWIATVGPSGRPRVRPVSGLYVEGLLYLSGVPTSGWVRDVASNSQVSIHLDLVGDDVVIVDGEAAILGHNSDTLAARLAAASNAKYPEYPVKPADYAKPGHIAVQLHKVVAWTSFTTNPTRFRFR
jgi:hypothetical protein